MSVAWFLDSGNVTQVRSRIFVHAFRKRFPLRSFIWERQSRAISTSFCARFPHEFMDVWIVAKVPVFHHCADARAGLVQTWLKKVTSHRDSTLWYGIYQFVWYSLAVHLINFNDSPPWRLLLHLWGRWEAGKRKREIRTCLVRLTSGMIFQHFTVILYGFVTDRIKRFWLMKSN